MLFIIYYLIQVKCTGTTTKVETETENEATAGIAVTHESETATTASEVAEGHAPIPTQGAMIVDTLILTTHDNEDINSMIIMKRERLKRFNKNYDWPLGTTLFNLTPNSYKCSETYHLQNRTSLQSRRSPSKKFINVYWSGSCSFLGFPK